MRYRTMATKGGLVLQIEDGDEVLVTVPIATPGEAVALIRTAKLEGVEAIRPLKKATKK